MRISKNINRYIVAKKYGDKMLALINRFHYEGVINMAKTDNSVIFTVESNTESDFYDILPISSLSPKILDPKLFIKSKRLIMLLKNYIKKEKNDGLDISDLNLNLIEILIVLSNLEGVKKLLIVKDICIFIGYKNRVIRIDCNTIRRYSPKFSIFEGFRSKSNEVIFLNKVHNVWIQSNKDPNDKIFKSDIIDYDN